MTQKRNCIVAFSLAEVLIAMTIIGVVAMLVIPGLRKYTSQHAFVTQLKKSYMTLNQSLDFAFADDIGVDIEKIGGSKFFQENLMPTFNAIKICNSGNMYASEDNINGCLASENEGLTLTPQNAVILADGSTIANDNMYYIIDVNGPNLPNVVGSDIFTFELKKVKGEGLDPEDKEEAATTGTLAMLTPMLNKALEMANNAFIPAAYAINRPNDHVVDSIMRPDYVMRPEYGIDAGGGGGGGGSSSYNGGPLTPECRPGYDCDPLPNPKPPSSSSSSSSSSGSTSSSKVDGPLTPECRPGYDCDPLPRPDPDLGSSGTGGGDGSDGGTTNPGGDTETTPGSNPGSNPGTPAGPHGTPGGGYTQDDTDYSSSGSGWRFVPYDEKTKKVMNKNWKIEDYGENESSKN